MRGRDRRFGDDAPTGGGRSDPWKVAFVTLLVAGLLGIVVWLLLGSRLLVVRQVEVGGTDRLAREEVVAAVDVATGTPLVTVDTEAAARRVAKLRLVESAEVRRAWPAALEVRVAERAPVLSVRDGDGYLLVDPDGVRVTESASRPGRYPLVRVSGEVAGDPGVAETARVVEDLPEDVLERVESIDATDPARLILLLDGGASVVWGDAERGDDKARALRVLLRQHPPGPDRRYDVSAEGVAVVR